MKQPPSVHAVGGICQTHERLAFTTRQDFVDGVGLGAELARNFGDRVRARLQDLGDAKPHRKPHREVLHRGQVDAPNDGAPWLELHLEPDRVRERTEVRLLVVESNRDSLLLVCMR